MSGVQPAPPPPASTSPAAMSPRVQVVAEPHADTARLPVGTRLAGHVVPGAPRGLVHIQTDAGMLVGRSTLPLAEGTDVGLLLRARTPQLHLQIISTNGQAPGSPQAASAAPRAVPGEAVAVGPRPPATRPDTPAPAPPTAARTPPPLAPGASIDATLLQAAKWLPSATGPSTALPAGSALTVRVVAVHSPAAGAGGAAAPPSMAAPGSVTGSASVAAGQILRGTVTTPAPGARPMLATPFGPLGLNAVSALPPGSGVTLEIVGAPVPSPTVSGNAGTPANAHPNPALAEWPALEAAVRTLSEANPAAARHVMNTVLPRIDSGLTSQTLFLLQALGKGSVEDWLGEAPVRALKAAHPALLSQLGEEFRHMGRAGGETETGEWRVLHVGLSAGTQIEPVRLLLRRHGGGRAGGAKDGEDTRFVVDITLSRLGRIQFDGLVREDGKRLDLIVRSDPPLPPALRGNIRTLFAHSGEIAGLKGDVGFQASPPEFVEVMAEYPANPQTGMIV